MTILGIDPSLTSTGLAVAENQTIVWTQAVKSTGTRGDGLTERERRIYDIVNRVRGAVDRSGAQFAVIEAPSFGSQHGSAHDRSGLWWAIVRMLYIRGLDVAQVAPKARAKYGTGNGNSQKKDVHAAVKARYGRPDLPITTNDEGDAVLLAAMGARALNLPVEGLDLPVGAVDALRKVDWP